MTTGISKLTLATDHPVFFRVSAIAVFGCVTGMAGCTQVYTTGSGQLCYNVTETPKQILALIGKA